jgi:hypothetical protein
VLDVVIAQLIWDPTPVWSVSLTGSWSLRQQVDAQTTTAVGLGPPAPVALLIPGDFFITQASPATSLRFAEQEGLGDVMTYQASLRVKRRFGRRTEVFGQLTYLRQDYDDDPTRDAFDNFRALLGARWMFDPINVL